MKRLIVFLLVSALPFSTYEPAQPQGATRAANKTAFVAAAKPEIRTTRRNPVDRAEMVYIPAGPFIMGLRGEDPDDPNANRRRIVKLSAFWIYRNLVTVAQYWQFCRATHRKMPVAPDFDPGWKLSDNQIVNVTDEDALAYSRWAHVDLPSAAQFEKAA